MPSKVDAQQQVLKDHKVRNREPEADFVTTVRPALYYPYIHIRSEQWLKAVLLCAPSVKRIVPETYVPEDDPIIERYTKIAGPNGTLLQAVAPATAGAMEAQERLLRQFEDDRAAIKRAYSKMRAEASAPYYIHTEKFTSNLLHWLRTNKLAWPDHHPKAYGQREWHALHPTLGKAIMTTLGLSIASDQHYDVVTADGAFHEALLATSEEDVFHVLRRGTRRLLGTRAQARHDLIQRVIILSGVNFAALRPEDIPELQSSKHFQGFQRILRHATTAIEVDTHPEAYAAQIKEEADHIISSWQDVKRTLSKTVRGALFDAAITLSAEGLKALTKIPDKMALVVAGGMLITRTVSKVSTALKQRDSPYQYLTQIVNAQQPFTKVALPLGLER
jgi:hypothetical protein